MSNSKILTTVRGDEAVAIGIADEVDKLKATIFFLMNERNRTASKLIGIQALSEQLESKEEECRFLKSKLEQHGVLLARAENRIAQLSLQAGKGPQNAAARGCITPGVSKKVLETLTRENTRLRLALEHLANKSSNGVELAVENLDLHNIIMTLKEELKQGRVETEELRGALRAVETDDTMQLQEQVAKLTGQLTSAERNVNAKQVFCESVVIENERLKTVMESIKHERITQVILLKQELGELAEKNPELKDVMNRVAYGVQDQVDGDKKREEELQKRLHNRGEELKVYKEAIEAQRDEMENQKERSSVLQQQLIQKTEQNTLYEEEMQSSKAELGRLVQQLHNKHAEIEDFNFEKTLMQDQLQGFENDFKLERQEKEKIAADLDSAVKQNQDLDRKCRQQSQEIERFKLFVSTEQHRQQQAKSTSPPPPQVPLYKGQSSRVQLPARCASQMAWQIKEGSPYRGMGQVCVDGGTRGNEASAPKPAQRQSSKSLNRLLCPICKKFFPYDVIEIHLTDCSGERDGDMRD